MRLRINRWKQLKVSTYHSWSRTVRSSRYIVFERKSIPMVGWTANNYGYQKHAFSFTHLQDQYVHKWEFCMNSDRWKNTPDYSTDSPNIMITSYATALCRTHITATYCNDWLLEYISYSGSPEHLHGCWKRMLYPHAISYWEQNAFRAISSKSRNFIADVNLALRNYPLKNLAD